MGMRGERGRILVVFLLVLLFGSSTGPLLTSAPSQTTIESLVEPEWVQFDLREGVYHDAWGEMDEHLELEVRDIRANSTFGTFDVNGLQVNRPVPSEWMQPRFDLLMVLISDETRFSQARQQLDAIQGLEVREYIAPSGLMVQGTPHALQLAEQHDAVASTHAIPIGMLLDGTLMDVLLFEGGEIALTTSLVRLEGWRDDQGPTDLVHLNDAEGGVIEQRLSNVAAVGLSESRSWDQGRFEGYVQSGELVNIMRQPSVMSLRPDPAFAAFNDLARGHMGTNNMKNYFTTALDGSGQIVAVADSGLDGDHGDFGTRVVGSYDVIGDGSTADKHTGHGTHVSCTILGDGTRGGYGGVAQSTELYFQAMENDNTGNFQSPSLNNLLNTAYNANARIHTNSWGSSDPNQQSKYNSETEDVDDRANYYDRYYNGREGLTILFAAGNDGPGSSTVSPPATAKNIISVGNHQNRYNGAPDNVMQGSSRGPTDDGRLKPDVIAPGGYVRSCRAQEATDTDGATWSNTYYMEYTGTSMATPNAAGVAVMVREYLVEIAQRPSPQGALIKALLVLGAQDVGTRDVPNDDEGWGRINLRNTLAPPSGQGIWVDDRSVMSNTGNSKTYSFNISQSSDQFKAVLTWSDERGSRFSNKQLVNDLDLTVEAPDGTLYLGNDFTNGRSVTGGTRDSINNLEVVLIDNAVQGTWVVKVKDAGHSGSSSQPYAIAIMGHGVNDLRPDPMVQPDDFEMDVTIPQVDDPVQLMTKVFNFGNAKADSFPVAFEVDGNELTRQSIELGAGQTKQLAWSWTPQSSGATTLSFVIDPDQTLEEVRENNNRHDIVVNVTAPGVKLETEVPQILLQSTTQTTTSWNISLTNTALIPTNASMQTGDVTLMSTQTTQPWYVGSTNTNFTLDGQASEIITVTLVHPSPPLPGTYRIDLLGIDNDNGVVYPFNLDLIVPDLPEAAVEYDYQVVPVHPVDPTNISVRFFNNGNAPIGYDLFLEAPTGWRAGFTNLGSEAGATSGSTGLINSEAYRAVGLTFTPPQVMTGAGAERIVKLTAVSQTEQQVLTLFEIPIKVETIRELNINLESALGTQRPDTSLTMMYTIEHRGNVDLDLTPSFQLPSGWSVSSSLEVIELSWASSKNILYTLEASENAKSGEISLNLDNGSDRFTWTRDVVVEVLAKPSLTFVGLELADGTQYGTLAESGDHPSGEAMTFTWLLSNDADTQWSPSISLALDSGLFGDCDPIESVGLNGISPVICTLLIADNVPPRAEPSFTITLSDDGIVVSEIVGLRVASNEEVGWDLGTVPSMQTGTDAFVNVELTNIGNVPIQRQIQISTTTDWVMKVDGNDVVDLEPGQSSIVRLELRADRPGTGTMTLELVGSEASSPSFSFEATATGEPVGTSGSTGLNGTIVLTLLVVLAVLGLGATVGLRKQQSSTTPLVQTTPTAPLAGLPQLAAQPAMAPSTAPATVSAPTPSPVIAPICWSCRKSISGLAKGCPGCGARYHAGGELDCNAGQLSECVNCQGTAQAFIQA